MTRRISRVCSHISMSVGFSVISVMAFFVATVKAQDIRIKLVNGRNGRVVSNQCLNVWVGKKSVVAMLIQTGQDGVALLHLTENDAKISIKEHNPACGDLGVTNPVVRYADTIRILSGTYPPCQTRHAPWPGWPELSFATKEVLLVGAASANVCGKIEASPKPGDIILFVRPRTFWEKMKQ